MQSFVVLSLFWCECGVVEPVEYLVAAFVEERADSGGLVIRVLPSWCAVVVRSGAHIVIIIVSHDAIIGWIM